MNQFNDEVIVVDLIANGVSASSDKVISASYKLFEAHKSVTLISKDFSNGIVRQGNQLHIRLTNAELSNVSGEKYHELTIQHEDYGRKTIVAESIDFKRTFNKD